MSSASASPCSVFWTNCARLGFHLDHLPTPAFLVPLPGVTLLSWYLDARKRLQISFPHESCVGLASLLELGDAFPKLSDLGLEGEFMRRRCAHGRPPTLIDLNAILLQKGAPTQFQAAAGRDAAQKRNIRVQLRVIRNLTSGTGESRYKPAL